MECFYIIANGHKDRNLVKSRYIKNYLEQHEKRCILEVLDSGIGSGFTDPMLIPEEVDCVLVLGGDGTLLQAARDLGDRSIPFLGVNLGTLGYLAEVEETSIDQALDQLIHGEYEVEKRMMLKGNVLRGPYHEALHAEAKKDEGESEEDDFALNDITITRNGPLQIIKFQIYVNGQLLKFFRADGVIVATPTGSTGYNLSAGGPIVEPRAELILITPVCAHSLNTRSIVLSATDEIMIEIPPGRDDSIQQVEVNFDAGRSFCLYTGDRVTISKANKTTKIVKLKKISFLEVLHRKMSD